MEEMKRLPEKLREPAQAIIQKHELQGWKDIAIGLPNSSTLETPPICLWATNRSGERILARFDQNESVMAKIDAYLRFMRQTEGWR